MTLPNKLSVSRLYITPFFYGLFLYTASLDFSLLKSSLTWLLFATWLYCEISDVIDGYIARKHNLASDMGKILDPFADVISRITYFALFVQLGWIPMWPLIIIFWRELSITFIRTVIAKNGMALGASSAGKTKAIFYFITSLLGMLFFLATSLPSMQNMITHPFAKQLLRISFIIAALASVLSFISYFKSFLKTPYMKQFIEE